MSYANKVQEHNHIVTLLQVDYLENVNPAASLHIVLV